MFDIAFPELVLVGIVALLVLGPERLPGAMRSVGKWLGQAQRAWTRLRTELEKEIGTEDLRRQMQNEGLLEDARRFKHDVESSLNGLNPADFGTPRKPSGATDASLETTASTAPDAPGVSADHGDNAKSHTEGPTAGPFAPESEASHAATPGAAPPDNASSETDSTHTDAAAGANSTAAVEPQQPHHPPADDAAGAPRAHQQRSR